MSDEKETGIVGADGSEPTKADIPQPPRCPGCKQDITLFSESIVTLKNGFIVHMLWCSNTECRTLFSTHILGQAVPQKAIVPGRQMPKPFNPTLIKQ